MAHIYGVGPRSDELVQSAATLAKETALPAAASVDAKAVFPKDAIAALSERGFFGLTVPAEFGGKAQGPGVFAAVVEELAQGCASTAMVYVMHVSALQGIIASKKIGGREALLCEISAGKHLTTLAFSEKGSRSQFWAPVSKLRRNGSGFTVDAHKSWVTAAAHADSYVASAQSPEAKDYLDTTVFLARRSASGVRLPGGFDGLGLRGNDSAPVTFDKLPVASADLLTETGAGQEFSLTVVLPWFCIGTAAMANGLCRAAVAATAGHLTGNRFEHNATRLCDLPTLRARLGAMSVRTEQSRALLGHTIGLLEQPTNMTGLYVLQSRLAAIKAALDVTDLAMKACGGAAFSKHLGLERLFRDARAGWVMAPTVDHIEDFVGRALTGMPLLEV